MTNQQHPITPPPDKIHNWLQLEKIDYNLGQIITLAAQWGADQELKACCEFLEARHPSFVSRDLRAARRPKPPSLAEKALAQTDAILNDPSRVLLTAVRETLKLNRRALERLQELEGQGDD